MNIKDRMSGKGTSKGKGVRRYQKASIGSGGKLGDVFSNLSFKTYEKKVLASTGLAKLVDTGHEDSLRVDLKGWFVNCDVEKLEVRMLAALSSMKAYEVFAIQRYDGCTLLVDYRNPSKVTRSHDLLVRIQREMFKFLSNSKADEVKILRESSLCSEHPLFGLVDGRKTSVSAEDEMT